MQQTNEEFKLNQLFYASLQINIDKQILITIPDMQWALIHFWQISDLKAPIMCDKTQTATQAKVHLLGRFKVVPATHQFVLIR
jgi:hypothetical protein